MSRRSQTNTQQQYTGAGLPVAHDGRLFAEAWRFVSVGIINTTVDVGVLNLLIQVTQNGEKGLSFVLIKSTSFLVAVVNSYFLNRNWTFKSSGRRKTLICSGGKFLAISLMAAFMNVGVASYIATFVPPLFGVQKYWPSVAALIGTASSFLLNFLGYKYIVFAPHQRRPLLGVDSEAEI